MISKRIGNWSWTLSPKERETAAAILWRHREQKQLTTGLRRKHDAMVEKQRKLDELEQHLEGQSVTVMARSRLRFGRPSQASSAAWRAPSI